MGMFSEWPPTPAGHALGLDQLDHLADHVDRAAAHHVRVGHPAVRIDQRGALVDLALDLVAHLGLVRR